VPPMMYYLEEEEDQQQSRSKIGYYGWKCVGWWRIGLEALLLLVEVEVVAPAIAAVKAAVAGGPLASTDETGTILLLETASVAGSHTGSCYYR